MSPDDTSYFPPEEVNSWLSKTMATLSLRRMLRSNVGDPHEFELLLTLWCDNESGITEKQYVHSGVGCFDAETLINKAMHEYPLKETSDGE